MQQTETGHSSENKGANRVTLALLIVYLVALCWILILKLGVRFSYMEGRRVNWIPFREFWMETIETDVSGMVMNVVIFMPLGIYAGALFPNWKFGKGLLFFFSVSFLVEALQYILAIGAFDSTDLITNTTGGVLGLVLFRIMEKAFLSRAKAQRLVNLLAVLGTVLMLVFFVLLKMNKLPIQYQ